MPSDGWGKQLLRHIYHFPPSINTGLAGFHAERPIPSRHGVARLRRLPWVAPRGWHGRPGWVGLWGRLQGVNDAQYLTQVTPEAPVARRDLVNRWVYGLAIANLIAQIGIMVTEGMVRVARSGLAAIGVECADWPRCEPTAEGLPFAGYYTTIDVVNWAMMVAVVVIAVALLVATVKMQPTKRRPQRLHVWAGLPLIGVVIQAALGIAIVMTGDQPWIAVAHTAVSAVLVAISAWLINRLISPDVPTRPSTGWTSRVMGWLLGILGLGTAFLGVIATRATDETGAPLVLPNQLEGKDIGHIHAGFVILLTLVVVAGLVWALRSQTPILVKSRRAWITLLVLLVAQAGLGLAQIFLERSPVSVVFHLFGSGLVIAAIIWVLTYLYNRIPVLALAPAHH